MTTIPKLYAICHKPPGADKFDVMTESNGEVYLFDSDMAAIDFAIMWHGIRMIQFEAEHYTVLPVLALAVPHHCFVASLATIHYPAQRYAI